MNPWTCTEYKKHYSESVRTGIRLRLEAGIDVTTRSLFIDFGKWLRKNYIFPIRINVYIKNCETVKLLNGKITYGAFRWFGTYDEPYIRIPVKPDAQSISEYTSSEIREMALSSFVHELTHYFQWVNRLEQTNRSSEWQANYYRYRIIEQYCNDRGIKYPME